MDMSRLKELAGIDEGGMWGNSKPSIILRHMADPSNAKIAKRHRSEVPGEDWFRINDFVGILSDMNNFSFSQLRLLFRRWKKSGIIEHKNMFEDGRMVSSWYRITNKGLDQIKRL
tara:strand:- start:4393 stop:4737 length:345 start_codon:yes stop_codon:yes gene_type:complete